jgi:2-polyprenyl-3-methyl-5-hydroxy-6-metoxy-1,4-benzoquinol methylase
MEAFLIYLNLHLALVRMVSSESVREFTRLKLTAMTEIKQLLTAFERYAYGQSLHTAFTELIDWTLLPFKKWDSAEGQCKAFDSFRKHPKVDQLTTLIKHIGDLSEDFNDPIGELYMQAISNGFNGQYFTPTPVCQMISSITIGEGLTNKETICDPACGSGRMLLAAAKVNRHSRFYGADLDITCCKMALVNMLLNSLTSEIAHMNTLSNEFYRGYKVCTNVVQAHHMPYFVEFLEPEQSYIWLQPLKGKQAKSVFNKPFEPVRASAPIIGVQASLF